MNSCAAGHSIPPDAPEGLCPLCLFATPPPPAPARVGSYHCIKELGRGGFGCVYLARSDHQEVEVALKVIRNAQFSDAGAVRHFRREAQLLSRLNAACFVRILDTGEHDGLPFFTMEYMSGGTLRDRMPSLCGSARASAELMIEIARAVQVLHGEPGDARGPAILHRDLKPENILFDADGRPKLSDFGIAKLAQDGAWTNGSQTCGCAYYVAPEQAVPRLDRALTAAADVYSLGAILYELFCGRPPFVGSQAQVLLELQLQEPIPPRLLVPSLDRYLETVVLNALEKDPARRYASAATFAHDLSRALAGRPPEDMPRLTRSARLFSFARRRPMAAFGWLLLLSLCVLLSTSTIVVLHGRQVQLKKQEQQDAATASIQAVAVRFQLREYAGRVARLARDPDVLALATAPEVANPSAKLVRRSQGFSGMFVLDTHGRGRARTTPMPAEYLTRSFEFRDYFQGARRLADANCADSTHSLDDEATTAYVARAHISESDGQFEFAVSAPLCEKGNWIGVIGATISSDRVLGSVRLTDEHADRITAIIGLRDRDRRDLGRPISDGFTFIAHPALKRGEEYRLLTPPSAQIRRALGIPTPRGVFRYAAPLLVDEYHDPVPGFAGLWSAALAPVDESGYVVLVQSRRETHTELVTLAQQLLIPIGLPFAICFTPLAWWAVTRQRRIASQRTVAHHAALKYPRELKQMRRGK